MRSVLPLIVLTAACAAAPAAESPNQTDGGSTPADGGPPDAGMELSGPPEQFMPAVTGTCPSFTQGQQTFTVNGKSRNALLWVSSAAETKDGPLVFWWHGAGGDPSEASYALGGALNDIVNAGGVVVAFYHDPNAGQLPWYLSLGGSNDTDLKFADEAVACAISTVGIDTRRIHSVGFSAGAMHNTQFVAYRSGYLASIVNYSGARLRVPTEQDPDNKYAAMLFHGGTSDVVSIVKFADETKKFSDALKAEDHFTFTCNHNQGHTVPQDGPAAAWRFLQDHPYGVSPEPYLDGLPSGFPSYCSL